ncbi:MAG: cation transporter [Myxococcales bacterium]|nr:cation transporter [Myxococcales bacterium]MCB9521594.1 cation transporter [Myxococcales bacterium]
MATEISVQGMTCGHCEASVVRALEALPGAGRASADRGRAVAKVEGDVTTEAAVAAVNAIGFVASPRVGD